MFLRDFFPGSWSRSQQSSSESKAESDSKSTGTEVTKVASADEGKASSNINITDNMKKGWSKLPFPRKESVKLNSESDKGKSLTEFNRKYPYCRPSFLEVVTLDELQVVLNHSDRVVLLPKKSCLPKFAGYAECTNAGKSSHNEDQAATIELKLGLVSSRNSDVSSPFIDLLDNISIYGVFDGHAGSDAAVTVSHELPHRIKKRISDVIEDLTSAQENNVEEDTNPKTIAHSMASSTRRKLTVDRLVIGALEAAFHDMDDNLLEDEAQYYVKGGCAVNLALFYAGKLYVANAGDSRAVLSISGEPIVMSKDCTPEIERRRLQQVAEQNPELLQGEFCSRQFVQRVTRRDVGTEMLYRDSRMEGWANRIVTEEDLRFPLIMGEGKRARLLATIGLTRGLGDHNLKVFDSNIMIKPFLSSTPEVKVFDLSKNSSLTADDVLILGTDGLWDVISNFDAIKIVRKTLSQLPVSDNTRYIAAAHALVTRARGVQRRDRQNIWVLDVNTFDFASHDDITCFVIPLIGFLPKNIDQHDLVSDTEQSIQGNTISTGSGDLTPEQEELPLINDVNKNSQETVTCGKESEQLPTECSQQQLDCFTHNHKDETSNESLNSDEQLAIVGGDDSENT